MQRTDSLEETLMLGKLKAGKEGDNRMRWLEGITDSMDMSLSTDTLMSQGTPVQLLVGELISHRVRGNGQR